MSFKRHRWEAIRHKSNLESFQKGRERRCVRCGVVQTMTQDHVWMRVTRTYWWPEEETRGPCRGVKDDGQVRS
jgi:hypothetical protein